MQESLYRVILKLEDGKKDRMKLSKLLKEQYNNTPAGDELYQTIKLLGYKDFYEFVDDNPEVVEQIMQWITGIPEFEQKLSDAGMEDSGYY